MSNTVIWTKQRKSTVIRPKNASPSAWSGPKDASPLKSDQRTYVQNPGRTYVIWSDHKKGHESFGQIMVDLRSLMHVEKLYVIHFVFISSWAVQTRNNRGTIVQNYCWHNEWSLMEHKKKKFNTSWVCAPSFSGVRLTIPLVMELNIYAYLLSNVMTSCRSHLFCHATVCYSQYGSGEKTAGPQCLLSWWWVRPSRPSFG